MSLFLDLAPLAASYWALPPSFFEVGWIGRETNDDLRKTVKLFN